MFRSAHIRRLALRILTVILACGAFSLPNPSYADNRSCDYAEVKVVVRSIQASGPKGSSSATAEPVIDETLTDLKQKLGMLPFSSFKLISSKEEQISLKRKETVRLPNGQSISLRPMYMNKERVGLWLSWKDTDGNDILNTRIHFDADESVLTGTDYENNEGRILAIKAVQVN